MVFTVVVLFFTLVFKLFLTVMTLNRSLPLVVVTVMVQLFILVTKLFLTVMTLIYVPASAYALHPAIHCLDVG